MRTSVLIAAIIGCVATSAAALQPLHQNPTVIVVRKNCDSISPRWVTAYNYLRSLESYARKAGYTDAQIEELADNKAEKKKLQERILADLAERGATPQTPEGYCTVGLEEIAKGSAAGKLLRAR